ncbi:hypothetical protein CWI42_081070 [Ordospora colligata]|uniref:Uncharacterized protein n=1 Tax=Ordospora colligata OC4 TaxID=1354746 RepID=A0A0B2UE68_9MICR|nr:uncharacterized protein M896_081070 [Ordospora colligata OC4]KHN69371.1 hypothetical protein M896_081070 [Ordospora colligata OC4]TBU14885.1 hypothetical protein CWI41_081060 [Ordospora colligata]TBU15016.1 hypothetical protein CWI40_081080 [Ordospora colligata]TBU18270.1 hypothetical protein CWI42_081070 [Ordospora colligata]
MPVKEKETLVDDIKLDLLNIRAMVLEADDISRLDECDFRKLAWIYKNPQQQVIFIRKMHNQIIQEVLKFLFEGRNIEAVINICILYEIYDSQDRMIDIEMQLEWIEAINQHLHSIEKKVEKDVFHHGLGVWDFMRSINAIRICITPFPEDDQCLMALEDELCQISNALDRFEAEGEFNNDLDGYVEDANEK